MAVAFTSGTATSGNKGTAASFTYTSFAVSGSNPVVLVKVALVSSNSNQRSVSSVVCSAGLTCADAGNGANNGILIKAQQADDGGVGNGTKVEIWALVAPSGTGTITVTLSASTDYQTVAELYAGADQTTPCPTADAGSASGATNPLSVTPANLTANDAASGIGANGLAGDGPNFDQTDTYVDNTSNVNMSAGYHLGTGAVSCTWGSPHAVDAFVGVRIAAAAGGGGAAPKRLLTLGVGDLAAVLIPIWPAWWRWQRFLKKGRTD